MRISDWSSDVCSSDLLYTERLSAAEVAAHFGVDVPDIVATNAPSTVHPGAPGMVVRAESGRRILQSMGWGFPLKLASMKPGSTPKAVNNRSEERLVGKEFVSTGRSRWSQ